MANWGSAVWGTSVWQIAFGRNSTSADYTTIENQITGSMFSLDENATLTSVTADINITSATKTGKFLVYRHSDLAYLGQTSEGTWTTGHSQRTLNFASPLLLIPDTYILCAWCSSGGGVGQISYAAGVGNQGHYDGETYGSPPSPLAPTHNGNMYNIYATYSSTYTGLTKGFTFDAVLSSTETKTFTVDAELSNVGTKTFTVDASPILGLFTKTFTLDGLTQAEFTKALTADGYLILPTSASSELDALLQLAATKGLTVDAELEKAYTKAFTIDTVLRAVAKELTLDSILQEGVSNLGLFERVLAQMEQYTGIETVFETGVVEPGVDNYKTPLRRVLEGM